MEQQLQFLSIEIKAVKSLVMADLPTPEYVAENPEIKPALNKLYRACEYIDLARAALETGEDA